MLGMDPIALALVLGGASLHATWNLFAKKASAGLPFVWLYDLVSVLVFAPFALWAWHGAGAALPPAAWAAILGSSVAHQAYALALQRGYRAGDFSVVYPVARGSGPLVAVLAAVVLLGERPPPAAWAGIAAILLGILLISGLRLRRRGAAGAGRAGGPTGPGLLWGLLTGSIIATYTVIDGWTMHALRIQPLPYYVLGLTLRAALLAPVALRDRPALREQWRRNARAVLTVGLLSPLAYLMVLYAMGRAPLAYVAPARELSLLIGMVLGALVLREGVGAARLLGGGSMLAGVVLLALAR